MRILLMTTKMDAGGAERYLYEHIKHMDRTNLQIDYYLLYNVDSLEMKNKYEELDVCIFERNLNIKGGKGSITYIKDMKRFYEEHGTYDVIHVNGTVPVLQMCAMYVAKKAGISVRVVHSHSAPEEKKSLGVYLNRIARIGTRYFATNLLACSQKAGEYKYGTKGVLSPKFRVMKNGIDTECFRFNPEIREKVREENGWTSSSVIIHVGRLSKEKNQIFLIRIVEELYKEIPQIKLALVGDGPDRTMLEKYVKNAGIEQVVEFWGNQKDVHKFLQGADVFCLPSLFEGFPIAGMEAQSMGLECVVSDAVPKDWNLSGNVCYLSLDDSIVAWKKAIVEAMLDRREDKSELLRKKGYDISDTSEELRRIYTLKREG